MIEIRHKTQHGIQARRWEASSLRIKLRRLLIRQINNLRTTAAGDTADLQARVSERSWYILVNESLPYGEDDTKLQDITLVNSDRIQHTLYRIHPKEGKKDSFRVISECVIGC